MLFCHVGIVLQKIHPPEMSYAVLALFFLLIAIASPAPSDSSHSEFRAHDGILLNLRGLAELGSDGLVTLTDSTEQGFSQIFYASPIQFKNSTNSSLLSFSTTFIFAITSECSAPRGQGFVFLISPTKGLPGALSPLPGFFNDTNDGNRSDYIMGVKLQDEEQSIEFGTIKDDHVLIDSDFSLSVKSASAGYYGRGGGGFKTMSLLSGDPVQVWIEYSADKKQLDVTLHPLHVAKPERPLLSLDRDLSPYLQESMYVGLSSSSGNVHSSHYIMGWTFKINGDAPPIDLSRVPKLPPRDPNGSGKSQRPGKILPISLSLSGFILVLILASGFLLYLRRRRVVKVLDDWEVQFGPLRFTYKELLAATNGFDEKELLGKGGSARVYLGVLSSSNAQAAVKRISHDSTRGMREFVAEIATIGRLSHRNLVKLLGYCRHKGELYLVYDYMPNGSLDNFLYGNQALGWNQRFKIIKDVASALLYLHEQWVQVIIHRDIKPANVLMDKDMNARLGDFGLARFCDPGINPHTSRIAGTLGYISPELGRTGKASTSSDVFAFGVFMLEVTCGRRPLEGSPEETVLADWVLDSWDNGGLLGTVDGRLCDDYHGEQVEMVLKLGLLSTHPVPSERPTMSEIMQFLDGAARLPDNLLDILKVTRGVSRSSHPVYVLGTRVTNTSMTLTESFKSHGR